MARASKASSAVKKAPARPASPVKKAAVPKKSAAVKKAAPAKQATPKKAAPAKNAAPSKKATPAKKSAPAKATPAPVPAPRQTATPTKKMPVTTPSDSSSKPAKATKATAAPKRAKKVKSPFDSRFLERQRKLLKVERDTYERQAIHLKAEADSLVADMDPGDAQFDEEGGEGDTIAVERNRDLALAARALEMIEEIDHAAAKLELGTYGICEVSGEPIPEERLEALPWAREKVEFKVGGFGRR